MLTQLRDLGAWISRNVFGYGKPAGKKIEEVLYPSNPCLLFKEDKVGMYNWIVKKRFEVATQGELGLLQGMLRLHLGYYKDKALYRRGVILIAQRSYQIDALRRGEYPIVGVDVLAEMAD